MWQISREWTAGLGPALVLALLACSAAYSQDVRTRTRKLTYEVGRLVAWNLYTTNFDRKDHTQSKL